jgi:hypothetical protein
MQDFKMNEKTESSDLMEKDVISYLVKHKKEWLRPSSIARQAGQNRDLQYNFYAIERFLKQLFLSKNSINGERVERSKINSAQTRYRLDPPSEEADTICCECCHEEIRVHLWEEAVCPRCNTTYRLMKDPDCVHMLAEGLVKKDFGWSLLGGVGILTELMEIYEPFIRELLAQIFRPQTPNQQTPEHIGDVEHSPQAPLAPKYTYDGSRPVETFCQRDPNGEIIYRL